MQSIERSLRGITIVDLAGRLRVEDGVSEFRALIAQLTAAGRHRIVLNLSACPYVDSAGFGELATALVTLRKAGGQLVLLNPTERVEDLLRITKLLDLFIIQRDEAAAIDAVQIS